MNSDELTANAFRASLARQKLEREHIEGKENANQAHYQVGKIVRQAIAQAGGIMPEEMPIPDRSIQQLQSDEQKRLERSRQPTLFEEPADGEPPSTSDEP